MNVDDFKKHHGKGPSGTHPLNPENADAKWVFEIETAKTVQEFTVPGSSLYGAALRSAKSYCDRMFPDAKYLLLRLVK